MRLVLVSALFVLSACTELRPVDDRLSYEAQERIEQRVEQGPAFRFNVDEASKHIQWTGRPSGLLFAAYEGIFPIGKTLTAYLHQAERVMPRQETAIAVKTRIVDVDMEYTNGVFSYGPNIDWVRLSLALDTILPDGRIVTTTYQEEEDVASGAMILDPQNDRALVVVLERITSRYIDDVLWHLRTLKASDK